MLPGQNFQTFTTNNLQLTVYSSFIEDTINSKLEPPQNSLSSFLNKPTTHLILPELGWTECITTSDSISYSIL